MILGDWIAPEPLQGIHLTPLGDGLWDLRAVGICGGLAPHAVPAPGVMAYASTAKVYTAIIQTTSAEIRAEAARFDGVAHRCTNGAWIIKGIAPKMRAELA